MKPDPSHEEDRSIYFEEISTQVRKDAYINMFTEALFIINKKGKQNSHK